VAQHHGVLDDELANGTVLPVVHLEREGGNGLVSNFMFAFSRPLIL
jgi:hypothetical protein